MVKDNGFLDNFLKKYEPKKESVVMSDYLSLNKLKGYKTFGDSEPNISNMWSNKFYVMYIKNKYFLEKNINDSIVKNGGFFVSGGIYIKDNYVPITDPSKWTHVELRLIIDKENIYEYKLSLKNNFLFFKFIDKKRKFMNEFCDHLQV